MTHRSISGYEDPADEAPWALQLVVRIEKIDPPTRSAACAAAAKAVVALLTHPAAAAGGDWFPAIDRWTDGRIRKHCRRARGAAWEKVQDLPGVTVTVDAAQVRAFVPTAVDTIPRDIGKLQLSFAELDDPNPDPAVDDAQAGTLVICLPPQPFLPLGKAAAAAGHAAQVALMGLSDDEAAAWAERGFPIRIEQPDADRWARLADQSPVQIVDAGFTVVEPGTMTAVARWA